MSTAGHTFKYSLGSSGQDYLNRHFIYFIHPPPQILDRKGRKDSQEKPDSPQERARGLQALRFWVFFFFESTKVN